jgi:mannose-6-phosphate isomerase-like protein (cupin superfamily)
MSEPYVLGTHDGRVLNLGNFEAVVLAGGETTSGEFALLRTQNEPHDFGPPLHLHRDAAESFYVLEGEYIVYINDDQFVARPGSFVYVPANTPHTFKVSSASAGKKLNLFTPAAMTCFFERLALLEEQGEATPATLEQIASENHMQVLGPVPDTYLR